MGGGAAIRAAARVAGVGVAAGIRPTRNLLRNPDYLEASGCITCQSTAIPSHAEEALTLLNKSPAVQSVFDSIASDPKVREAVLKNEALTSFLETQKNDAEFHSIESSAAKGAGQTPGLNLLRNPDYLETSGCITCQSTATPLHAVEAFTLFNKSPAVQSVVASIASDPNVWKAVLKNEALTSFLETQKNDTEFHSIESPRKSNALSDDVGSSVKPEFSNESSFTDNSETRPVDILEKIKKAVIEMATNVSSFVQNLFGSSSTENVSDSATDEKAKTSTENDSDSANDEKAKTNFTDNKSFGGYLISLAIMVIMVVVMKRV